MDEERYKNIAVALLTFSGLVLFLAKYNGKTVQLGTFLALALILGMALMFPFVGFLAAIPITLIVWFDNQKAVWAWWDKASKAKINFPGGN